MPIASALMPQLEGLVSTGLRAARAPQYVITWKNAMREIMFSQGLRDATDWNIVVDSDAVAAAGASLDGSGGTVYGVLVDTIFSTSNENLICIVANVTGTLDGAGASLDLGAFAQADATATGGVIAMVLNEAADASNARFGTFLDPAGVIFTANIFAMSDGDEGTAVTANDTRIYCVYRDSTEVRV